MQSCAQSADTYCNGAAHHTIQCAVVRSRKTYRRLNGMTRKTKTAESLRKTCTWFVARLILHAVLDYAVDYSSTDCALLAKTTVQILYSKHTHIMKGHDGV